MSSSVSLVEVVARFRYHYDRANRSKNAFGISLKFSMLSLKQRAREVRPSKKCTSNVHGVLGFLLFVLQGERLRGKELFWDI